jgi:hypothetical protein
MAAATRVWGDTKKRTCVICGGSFFGMGNNPHPYGDDDEDRACDACNNEAVIPARIGAIMRRREEGK